MSKIQELRKYVQSCWSPVQIIGASGTRWSITFKNYLVSRETEYDALEAAARYTDQWIDRIKRHAAELRLLYDVRRLDRDRESVFNRLIAMVEAKLDECRVGMTEAGFQRGFAEPYVRPAQHGTTTIEVSNSNEVYIAVN